MENETTAQIYGAGILPKEIKATANTKKKKMKLKALINEERVAEEKNMRSVTLEHCFRG